MENLASKYRPKTLEDVCEQDVVIDIVRNICKSKDVTNRNFLFIGPAGCGKTTTARIIANELNEGKGDIIEIDAASHSGVDSMREIISQMRQYPVGGSRYKVFIIDECFPGDSLVHTTSGLVPIRNIKQGDRVYNLTGEATVSHVFENSVKTQNLVCLRLGNKKIVTTKDHLVFTDEGWVRSCDLKEGDIVYDYQTVQEMRKELSSQLSQRHKDVLQQGVQDNFSYAEEHRSTYLKLAENMSNMWRDFLDSEICQRSNLWNGLRCRMEEATSRLGEVERRTCEALAYVYVSSMRKAIGDSEQRSSKSVFSSMLNETSRGGQEETSSTCDEAMRELWEYISSSLGKSSSKDMQQGVPSSSNKMEEYDSPSRNLSCDVREDESKQSGIGSRDSEENASNQDKEWHIDSEVCYAMWERTLLQAADSFEERIRGRVEIGISCEDRSEEERQSESISIQLQARPCLAKIDARSRGGWDRPQYEIATTLRRKESEVFRGVRVDSVESYERGSNEELFRDCFPDTSLRDAEYVTMYDLEIEGHPSYFVEDVLVHNCHSISSQGWQALLKTLEEQPARTICCLCTTNPEKIPATILSRVQTFQLSKISLNGIFNRLKYIVDEENKEGRGISYEDDALLFIAKMASGGMRSGITMLDKAIMYSKDITIGSLEKSLGLPNYDSYFDMLNAIARKDNETIVKTVNSVYNSGVNFVKWFDGFFSFITNIVKFIYLQDINQTMIPNIYQDKISKYGTAHSALCLKLANKLVKMNQELKTTQYLQELAISYLCTPPVQK